MTKTTTITINGRLYDAKTGKPVAPASQPAHRAFSDIGMAGAPRPSAQKPQPIPQQPPQAPQAPQHTPKTVAHNQHAVAQSIHNKPQKSQTLYRKALKKPEVQQPAASITTKQLQARSPMISKFGNNHVTVHPELTRQAKAEQENAPMSPPQVHPTVAKVLQQQNAAVQQAQISGKELKEQLIKERLAEVSETENKHEKSGLFKSKPRIASILTASLAILVLSGYLTYMNLPVISMKVAASRAGISATFPNYRPDGYNLDGPISYSAGQVNINYKSNTNDNSFKVSQKASNWDSQGLLDNFVTKQTENYLTFQEHGITIYTFANKAAWVNGGLLYTLEGSANLSSDQILRIATSM